MERAGLTINSVIKQTHWKFVKLIFFYKLLEKNQVLVDENKKLKAKCNGLEELLSEEEIDINDVLELIRNIQVKIVNFLWQNIIFLSFNGSNNIGGT